MVTYVRTKSKCGGLVVTKKQGQLRSNRTSHRVRTVRHSKRSPSLGRATKTAATPRRQIPHKPLGETAPYPKRRQKPRTSVGGSSTALLIGLRGHNDNPDMTGTLGLCGGELEALDDHKA